MRNGSPLQGQLQPLHGLNATPNTRFCSILAHALRGLWLYFEIMMPDGGLRQVHTSKLCTVAEYEESMSASCGHACAVSCLLVTRYLPSKPLRSAHVCSQDQTPSCTVRRALCGCSQLSHALVWTPSDLEGMPKLVGLKGRSVALASVGLYQAPAPRSAVRLKCWSMLQLHATVGPADESMDLQNVHRSHSFLADTSNLQL